MDLLTKERKEELEFDNFSYNREYVRRHKFIMLNNCYLQPDVVNLIKKADKTLARKNTVNKIDEIVRCLPVSQLVELGVFEFSINYVKTQDLNFSELELVYNDKINELCLNLDVSNINIKNKTLLPSILRGEINPQTIAFQKFHHLHPENWKTIIDKNNLRDEILYTVNTTDEFKCGKCGERKHTYYITQVRAADEPATVFYTCVNCLKTFTKSM
jgi:DNA-directed RNA polymerase subunit M/transcription elongation factor TFIIS